MQRLLVCSESTKDFVSGFDRIHVVRGAPTEELLESEGAYDEVVAVGGGAVMDTAKILSKNPITCFPTTAAGSTATGWSVYWKGSEKCSRQRELPKAVHFIPAFVEGLPESALNNTKYDAISHCLDSFYSNRATYDSRHYAMSALQILQGNPSRADILYAGHIAGKAIQVTGTNLLHALSYPMTGDYNISHGNALGYCLHKLKIYPPSCKVKEKVMSDYKPEFTQS